MSSIKHLTGDKQKFQYRHIGPREKDQSKMLNDLQFDSLDELMASVIPESIRIETNSFNRRERTENEALLEISDLAKKNKVFRSYLGQGYYDTFTPAVIQRNILENPAWYTQYTPYQAEISQGRLTSLLNFQTMVMELTALEVANASVLDEATAAAEAMAVCDAMKNKKKDRIFLVSDQCFPQTVSVLRTRAKTRGIKIVVADIKNYKLDESIFGVMIQYPTVSGQIDHYKEVVDKVKEHGGMTVFAADLLALTLITPPGELGADIAVGSSQRFGVPMGFGGPHAGYFAARESLVRKLPGRIVGVSKDQDGKVALRLALQTREQHIRREKATSNICTAQALLANMAAMYAVYHGPEGLKRIANRVHSLACCLAVAVENTGHELVHQSFFDTVSIDLSGISADEVINYGHQNKINIRKVSQTRVAVSLDETTAPEDIEQLALCFSLGTKKIGFDSLSDRATWSIDDNSARQSTFLQQEVFNSYHSETELMRYILELSSKDLSLTSSMIPLGSCTMKLNAAAELIPVSWPEFSRMHPFAPKDQSQGYQAMIDQLETMLCELTGFDAFSLQPNSGAQGEYAGLLAITRFHEANNEQQRNICLIPNSAHGTNPASAVMAGMKVVVIKCDTDGNIDVEDLKDKINKYKSELGALMITYPSTHGVFEESVVEVCELIHQAGGQVYMDGANMNAQIGLCLPGKFGPDVCHLNLHKTFAIPHGGGGPGVGPVGVKDHLKPYLPTHDLGDSIGSANATLVSAAPYGSASILPVSWMYISMMGASGLKCASEVAILNANYIAKRLENHYPVLYRGKNGLVAHECIVDLRPIQKNTGITVEDVAKRLMDYGFHAPTIAWPVVGTMMIEPTESESLAEPDRFCDAMLAIRDEIKFVEEGKVSKDNNLIKNAPHTMTMISSDDWTLPYTRKEAAYPKAWLERNKFWPAVSRVDNAHGDRNFVCACAPMEDYE